MTPEGALFTMGALLWILAFWGLLVLLNRLIGPESESEDSDESEETIG